jgi:hypothetical protein
MTANAPQFEGITPYLHYDDVPAMIEWLTLVFGFKERGRWLDALGIVRNAEIFAGKMESGWMAIRSTAREQVLRHPGVPGDGP